MRMRTVVCSLLALIAGAAGLCVEEEDVARICTAGTDLGSKLSLAVEGCRDDCEGESSCGKRSLSFSEEKDYLGVLGVERRSSDYCYTTDEIESLFQQSLESKLTR